MLYAAVDGHTKRSQITVMDEAGVVIKRTQVASSRAGIHGALGQYRRPVKSVVEASYNWGPLYDWLEEVSEEVVLAHPAKYGPLPKRASRPTKSIRRPWRICCALI